MSDGFVGRMRTAVGPGRPVYHIDIDAEYAPFEVWVEPLVPGEPKPGEVWETTGGYSSRVTITGPPYNNHWSGERYVPTDRGCYRVSMLHPVLVHPWHRRADGSE